MGHSIFTAPLTDNIQEKSWTQVQNTWAFGAVVCKLSITLLAKDWMGKNFTHQLITLGIGGGPFTNKALLSFSPTALQIFKIRQKFFTTTIPSQQEQQDASSPTRILIAGKYHTCLFVTWSIENSKVFGHENTIYIASLAS